MTLPVILNTLGKEGCKQETAVVGNAEYLLWGSCGLPLFKVDCSNVFYSLIFIEQFVEE